METCSHTHVTASALIKTGPGLLVGVTITAASAASTITLYDNTAGSGTIVDVIKCVANESRSVMLPIPTPFSTGLYADLAGTGAVATVYFF